VFENQASISSLKKINTQMNMFQNSKCCFLSSLKLAILFAPEDVALHQYLCESMKLVQIPRVNRFELVILIGTALGDAQSQFIELVQLEPWLDGSAVKDNSEPH
jgi:hypothetical protein